MTDLERHIEKMQGLMDEMNEASDRRAALVRSGAGRDQLARFDREEFARRSARERARETA